jgi:predicted aspartyl protease
MFQVWRAGSGHLLVRPLINGRDGGYMVLDTGASGFVVSPAAAADLGLDAFGELFAASISGKV